MILKRITQSLRRQDWAMVAIEFVLVLMGVLLAFQINNWGNRRTELSAHQEITERLLGEAEEDVAYLRTTVRAQKSRSRDLNFVLERIEAGELPRGETDRFASGLMGLEGTLPLSPPSTVYQDIVSSGNLTKIGDPSLRRLIGQFRATLAFEDRVHSQIQASVPSIIRFPAINVSYKPSENLGQTAVSFDFQGILADERLRKELVRTGQMQRFLLRWREQSLRDAVRMCVSLGQSAGKKCNLHGPPPEM